MKATRKRRKVKASKPPKAVWGALISTGLNFVGGLINNKKQEEEYKEQQRVAQAQATQTHIAEDRIRLSDFNAEGEGSVDYYMEHGGKLANPSFSSKGGKLLPISSDMEAVKGQTHAEGGVTLYNEGGPIVEVEDDEMIKDGSKVYSDKLISSTGQTYADAVERIAKKKSKVEKSIGTGDSITEFTAKRKLQSLDKAENDLFTEQEMSKLAKLPNKKMGYGGVVKKAEDGLNLDMPEDNFLTKAAPYLDNAANLILTATTPKVPKPILQRTTPLKTKVNVNPQLTEVQRAVDASTANIKGSTSNSATARNEITSARLRGADAKANILAKKANVEANLHNANVQNAQRVTAGNLAKLNQNNMLNMRRSDDIQKRISDNVANLSKDIIKERDFKGAQRYNKERLDVASKMYQSDTTRRAMLNNPSELMFLKSNPDYGKQVLEMFKGTPEEAELRKLLGIPMVEAVGDSITPSGLANIN